MALAQYTSGAEDTHSVIDPQDGARLIRAFVKIRDPMTRQKIIDMVEEAAEAGLAGPQLPRERVSLTVCENFSV
jgi:hypothetical protein